MIYTPPMLKLEAFNCPHCNAYAQQIWMSPLWGFLSDKLKEADGASPSLAKIRMLANQTHGIFLLNENVTYAATQCLRCKEFVLWRNERIIYPNATTAPLPNDDMPDEIKKDFNEAREVFPISARSSAALLRLVIEKLSKHLGYAANKIDEAIGKMVADGIHPLVQQAFDVVRVIGNESVHPGQIDLRDDPDTALQLFKLINIIVEEKITKPQKVQELFNSYLKISCGTSRNVTRRPTQLFILKHLAKLTRHILLHRGKRMRIDVHRCRYGAMPWPLLHHFRIYIRR